MRQKWVISCEHGGNQIPAAYAPFFRDGQLILQTHRGYDPGALALFQQISADLADFSHYSKISRLLIELNRSVHHKNLFSSFTRVADPSTKKEIISLYYLPYRNLVESKIEEFIRGGDAVIHISVHSFTPELDGEVRNADIGLLYDPARKEEKDFCKKWKDQLSIYAPSAVVRMNYPYKGTADGFTTYLRKKFKERYCGIELEVNQKHATNSVINEALVKSLRQLKY